MTRVQSSARAKSGCHLSACPQFATQRENLQQQLWLTLKFPHHPLSWLVGWLAGRLVGWLVDRFVGSLVHWLAGWLVACLLVCLVGWLLVLKFFETGSL